MLPYERKLTPATLVTLSRFILVPVFLIFFAEHQFKKALILLVITGLTDMLDGFLARRFNMRTRLGSQLDPLADKFLMLGGFTMLAHEQILPVWLACLVIGRDFLIVFGVIWLRSKKIQLNFRPTYLSKLNTTFQICLLVAAFLFLARSAGVPLVWLGPSLWLQRLLNFLIVSTCITTTSTAVQYVMIGRRFYRFGERDA